MPRGGSQALADALECCFLSLGGEVQTGVWVESLKELPSARAVLLDVGPKQLLRMAGDRLPPGYARWLRRYRYGAGVCKVDYALDGPVPWQDEEGPAGRHGTPRRHLRGDPCRRAGRRPGRAPRKALCPARPAEPLRREPGSGGQAHPVGLLPRPERLQRRHDRKIEAQIERFAPGFKERILARHTTSAPEMERHNPNYVGGDVLGGASNLFQLVARPVPRPNPYKTPLEGVYLCSASTPPGGGVHGMCGHHAARAALTERFGLAGEEAPRT